MSLGELQALLDRSRQQASRFTLSLEGEVQTASQVQEFINANRNITIAVVRRNGLPHAAPVIAGCVDGEIYATVSPGSVLANCLDRNPEVAFTIADLVHTLIGAGEAEKIGRSSECTGLCRRLDGTAPFGMFAPEGWDGFISDCDLAACLPGSWRPKMAAETERAHRTGGAGS
jgi:hypothetical protein